jgi:hypothetical protein
VDLALPTPAPVERSGTIRQRYRRLVPYRISETGSEPFHGGFPPNHTLAICAITARGRGWRDCILCSHSLTHPAYGPGP